MLHRAAFGPREAVGAGRLTANGRRVSPVDPNASPIAKLTGWLRDNL